MHSDKRSGGGTVERRLLHADVDSGNADLDKIGQLGGFAINSGTSGNCHVYIPLARPLPAHEHKTLERALVRHLDADPSKISGADVLRPAGTLNWKPIVFTPGADPAPVTFLIEPSGATVDPDTIAHQLGANLGSAHTEGTVPPGAGEAEPVDLSQHPRVRRALAHVTAPADRSADTARVVGACYDSGLTLAQTRYVVSTRADLSGRLGDRNDDDIATLWQKFDTDRRQRQQDTSAATEDTGPIPFTSTPPLPAFPVDALPGWVADMVAGVSEATQTDPAMAGAAVLAALSACTGGCADIENRPGWVEPLNLYSTTVAGPGERKSAGLEKITRPLYEVERDLAAGGYEAQIEAKALRDIAAEEAVKAKRAAAAAPPEQRAKLTADAIGAASAAENTEIAPVPRLLADDATPEAITGILAEQGGRLAVISAEGGVFDVIAGRYSKLPNLDVWLKGHAGDPVRIDRIGRPPQFIDKPALTLGLMIQPAVLTNIAANHEFRGRGLLARFMYSLPGSKVGRRKINAAAVDKVVQKTYAAQLADLATGMRKHTEEGAVLTLTDTAQQAVQVIETAVEPTLAGEGELAALADWGAKYVGAVTRIAGILHLAQHGADEGVHTQLTAETIRAAHRVGAYFKACAVKVFTDLGADPVTVGICQGV